MLSFAIRVLMAGLSVHLVLFTERGNIITRTLSAVVELAGLIFKYIRPSRRQEDPLLTSLVIEFSL